MAYPEELLDKLMNYVAEVLELYRIVPGERRRYWVTAYKSSTAKTRMYYENKPYWWDHFRDEINDLRWDRLIFFDESLSSSWELELWLDKEGKPIKHNFTRQDPKQR